MAAAHPGHTPGPDSGVCFVFNRMDPGGAELRTLELVARFEPRRFTFLTLRAEAGGLDDELRHRGHEVVPMRPGVRGYRDAFALFRRRRFATVHSQLGPASGFILAAARAAGVGRRIAHFRSDGLGGTPTVRRSVALAASRFLMRMNCTHIRGVAPGTLQALWSRRWREDPRCAVLPNFVDIVPSDADARPGRAEGPVVVVNIGRDEPCKRRGLAIRVWAAFAQETASTLMLIGSMAPRDGELAARVGRSMVEAGRPSRVLDRGVVPHAGRELMRADVLLVTSEREGLPGVVLEALAAGTPVVSSDLPGAAWIGASLPGVVLVNRDSPIEDWVDALRRALPLDRNVIRHAFASSAFTEERVVGRYRELWGWA